MGVYIDMEMPTDDMKNIMILADGRVFQFSGYGNPKPLGTAVPVHEPHGRLGDLDKLMGRIEHDTPLSSTFEKIVRRYIENAPTVIPASDEGE